MCVNNIINIIRVILRKKPALLVYIIYKKGCNMLKKGIYFETRTELIKRTSKWLKGAGHPSDLTLNCVSQLLRLPTHATLDEDLTRLLGNMEGTANEFYTKDKQSLLLDILPLFREEKGFQQCGQRTKQLCLNHFMHKVKERQLTGNLKSDIQSSIEQAVMTVEYSERKNYELY